MRMYLLAGVGWICTLIGLAPIFIGVFAVLSWFVNQHLRCKDRELLQRYSAGCCLNCGYDLRGTPKGVCPECGKANIEM